MQATVDGQVIAQSDDIVETGGYAYFPPQATKLDLLVKSPKTSEDLKCPHGVQFYDVVVGVTRHERAAWSYEKPQPKMEPVRDRFGFWKDVKVA